MRRIVLSRPLISCFIVFALLFCCMPVSAQVPVITGYTPVSSSICSRAGTVAITVSAINEPTSYLWQYSVGVDGNYPYWSDITADGGSFNGSATATLNFTPIAADTSIIFRCIVGNASGASEDNSQHAFVRVSGRIPAQPVIGDYFDIGPPLTAICGGLTQNVEYKTTGFDWTSTEWNYDGSNVNIIHFDTTATIYYTPVSTSGTLSVKLINGCGASIPGTLAITVNLTPQTELAGTPGSTSCSYINLQRNTSGPYYDNTCHPINTITSPGNDPINYGTMKSCVTVQPAVQIYNGVPYVQRYYNIDMTSTSHNPVNSVTIVTLYFSQSDFDNYNTVRGSLPPLPTGPADAVGVSNLRITQFHGDGGLPGTYAGTAGEIDPDNNNIIWNNSQNRWEVTFGITGYSGFFISTKTLAALPLQLLSFSGAAAAKGNLLQWQTSAEKNVSRFEILRSNNGNNFNTLSSVDAVNNAVLVSNYSYTDNSSDFNQQPYYYRLKMIDKDGNFSFSKTILVRSASHSFLVEVSPNPVGDVLHAQVITAAQETAMLSLVDVSGKIVYQKNTALNKGANTITIDMSKSFSKGIYLLHIVTNNSRQVVKLVKE